MAVGRLPRRGLPLDLRQGVLGLPPLDGPLLPALLQAAAQPLLALLLGLLHRVHRVGHHVLHGHGGRRRGRLLLAGLRRFGNLPGRRGSRSRRGLRDIRGALRLRDRRGCGLRRRRGPGEARLRHPQALPEDHVQQLLQIAVVLQALVLLLRRRDGDRGRFRRGGSSRLRRNRIRRNLLPLRLLRDLPRRRGLPLCRGAAAEQAAKQGGGGLLRRRMGLRQRLVLPLLRLRGSGVLLGRRVRRGLRGFRGLTPAAVLGQYVLQIEQLPRCRVHAQQQTLGVHEGGINGAVWLVVVSVYHKNLFPFPTGDGALCCQRRWRRASYSSTAAAADALRDEIRPLMGMLTRKSQLSWTSRPMPSPSLPMTMAAGRRRSAS